MHSLCVYPFDIFQLEIRLYNVTTYLLSLLENLFRLGKRVCFGVSDGAGKGGRSAGRKSWRVGRNTARSKNKGNCKLHGVLFVMIFNERVFRRDGNSSKANDDV
jgi:hypothetical protein